MQWALIDKEDLDKDGQAREHQKQKCRCGRGTLGVHLGVRLDIFEFWRVCGAETVTVWRDVFVAETCDSGPAKETV